MTIYSKHYFVVACTLAFCAFALSAPPAAQAASTHAGPRLTPPDSYLQYKVYSVDQLIAQVSQNPVVRQRFARHFQIPESRVVSYMRANLVESYIPKTGHYTVYCVRRSGKFYPVKQTFRQGTKVFALRNGEPVMKWVCGNPLSRFLPAVQIKTASRPPKVLVAPSIQELTPADTVSVLVPSDVAAPVYQPLVPVSVAAASAPIFSVGGGAAGRSLLPLLLPVALVGVNAGHSSSSGTPVPVAAVPEASSLAYVAAVLPFLMLASRRLRRTSRS